MIYKNPYYRKVKGSFILLVSCGYCKTPIAKYQKVGKGNLLNLHIDRVIESSIDLSQDPNVLSCPNCNAELGRRMFLQRRDKEVFKMIRSTFNTKRID